MTVALDTNRLTDLLRGDRDLAETIEGCDQVWIPLVVLGEIRAGFYGALKSAKTQGGCDPIPENELWSAALALEHDLILIIRDQPVRSGHNCWASHNKVHLGNRSSQLSRGLQVCRDPIHQGNFSHCRLCLMAFTGPQ